MMFNIFSFLTPKTWIILSIGILVGFLQLKIISLKSEVSSLESDIKVKEQQINNLEMANTISKTTIDKIKIELDNSNKNITDLLNERIILQEDIKKYKKLSLQNKLKNDKLKDSIKNVTNLLNKTKEQICNEGLELNKKISETKYEEL